MNMDGRITNPQLRHDFLILFDVQDGNPNGDPDAGNMPRVDPETMQGLVTDVCLKRKVRDYIYESKKAMQGFDIYVKHRGILANEQRRAYKAIAADPQDTPNEEARKWMCANFYDIRMFGAVMTTGKAPSDDKDEKKAQAKKWNCGQVRGPVQLTFARSIDPISALDVSITRVALTNAGDTRKEDTDDETAGSGQMGRKAMLPYGLYLGKGFFSPKFARDTGVSSEDLSLFWDALKDMLEQDHSAARGSMSLRGLWVFSHENPLGNAHAHQLFDRLAIERKPGVEAARAFSDYVVTLDAANLPEGVTVTRVVG